MNKSDSIKNIAAALKGFHERCEKIKKTAENPFFKSKYAPLPEILEAIQKPLSDSGLIFTQFPSGDGLSTMLMHPDSGEWIEASYNIHPVKSDPQAIGSAITYARRYALASVLGLNVDEDDDGNSASEPKKPDNDLPWLNPGTPEFEKVKSFIQQGGNMSDVRKKYKVSKAVEGQLK